MGVRKERLCTLTILPAVDVNDWPECTDANSWTFWLQFKTMKVNGGAKSVFIILVSQNECCGFKMVHNRSYKGSFRKIITLPD